MPSSPCASCHRSLPIFANRMCHHCFAAWGAENGVPAEQMPKRCPAEDCDSYVMKRGLCDRHYRRFLDHGSTDKVRAVSKERRHPLYKNWLHLKTTGKLCERWQQNFWSFVEAVGDRPSPRHWADRPDLQQLYGPDNFVWRAPKLDTEHTLLTLDGRNAYQNALRALTPQWWVSPNLKRYYGLTREQYDALLAEQGGGCAVCGKTVDIMDGEEQMLAVDHCHETGEVRGLMCRNHNVGLGLFNDDPAMLRKMADYIERPKHTGLFVPKPGDTPKERTRGFANAAAGGVCQELGCTHAVKAMGLCPTHYARFRRARHAEKREPAAMSSLPTCTIDDCQGEVVARGLCQTHYQRWKRHGDAAAVHDTHGRPITQGVPQ